MTEPRPPGVSSAAVVSATKRRSNSIRAEYVFRAKTAILGMKWSLLSANESRIVAAHR